MTGRRGDAETRGRGDAGTGGLVDGGMRGRGDGETGRRADAETRGRADAETRGRADAETRGRADAETRGRGDAEMRAWGDGEMRELGEGETLGRGDTATDSPPPRSVSTSPTLRVSPSPRHPVSPSPRLPLSPSPRLPLSASPRLRVAASPRLRVSYPETVDPREAEHVLSIFESNRSDLLRRVTSAGIQARFPNLEVVINETTGDFVGRTGMPPWAAAATKNNRIELQPLPLLKRRRILETTLRHELVHVLVDSIGGGQTPRWLAEGMAIHLAGEGKMMERHKQNNVLSVETVEQALASAKSADEMQAAYGAAYKLVKQLVQAEGEAKVWKRVAERRYSVNRRAAATLIA